MIARLLRIPTSLARFTGSRIKIQEGFSCVLRSNLCGHNRYRVVVLKKQISRAVDRNTLKRDVFRIIRQWPAMGMDISFIIQHKMNRSEIAGLLNRLHKQTITHQQYKHI